MNATNSKPIQSVQHAIDILNCFEPACPSLSIAEISEKTGLHINTTRGLINTLVANHLLVRNEETMAYSLGLYFLGKSELLRSNTESYIALFKPYIDRIAENFHCSSSLQIVNQNEVFSIYCAYPSNRAYYIVLSEFTQLPLHATSSGKLLLLDQYERFGDTVLEKIKYTPYTLQSIRNAKSLKSQLDNIKKIGYSIELEEYAYDVGSIAIPIYSADGNLILTISATAFAKNLVSIRAELVAELKKAVSIWKS